MPREEANASAPRPRPVPSRRGATAATVIAAAAMACVGAGLGSACGGGAAPGRLDAADAKAAHEKDLDAYPTTANVGRWAKDWVKGEWVVSVGSDPFLPPNPGRWKNAFVKALVGAAGIDAGTAAFEEAASSLSTRLTVGFERIEFAAFPKLLAALDEPPLGFAFVRVEDGESLLRSFESPLSFPVGVGRLEAVERLARWQGDGLAGVPGVVWAEPNLTSRLGQTGNGTGPGTGGGSGAGSGAPDDDGLPPEFRHNSPMAQDLARIHASDAYKWINARLQDSRSSVAEVRVAVFDTGVDSGHPDLKDAMWVNKREVPGNGADDDRNGYPDDVHGIDATYDGGRDPTVEPRPGSADLLGPGAACPEPIGTKARSNCGHGTHVAGIIAAKHGGNLSTIGVCPYCKIISVRVSDRCLQPDTADSSEGRCVRPYTAYDKKTKWEDDASISDSAQIRGLTYISKLKDDKDPEKLVTNVVNMSLGKVFRSRAMSYVIRRLQEFNIVVVAAAGNEGTDTPSYPGAYASVVAVCATATEATGGAFAKAIFSNFGDWIDVCAPGSDIYSTIPGKGSGGEGLWEKKDGTSMAAPFVAGAVGMMLSVFKDDLSGVKIIERLKKGARKAELYADANGIYRACYAGSDVCDHLLGSGFLDLMSAIDGTALSDVGESNGRAVTSGCVVSQSSASRSAYFPGAAWSSMPPTLLGAAGLLGAARRARRMFRRKG